MKRISLIEGYEGVLDCYYINADGRVYNDRSDRFVNIGDNGKGYKRLGLKLKGIKKWKNAYVHRLVALSFIPNDENKLEVNHIDENKSNNDISNLEWVTRSENINHGTGIERQKENRVHETFVYDYKGVFLKRFDSMSNAGREMLGYKYSKNNKRVKDLVFFNHLPTVEEFNKVLDASPYVSVLVTNIRSGETVVLPSHSATKKYINANINMSEYIELGYTFKNTFSFERYYVDRIGMPNLHEEEV